MPPRVRWCAAGQEVSVHGRRSGGVLRRATGRQNPAGADTSCPAAPILVSTRTPPRGIPVTGLIRPSGGYAVHDPQQRTPPGDLGHLMSCPRSPVPVRGPGNPTHQHPPSRHPDRDRPDARSSGRDQTTGFRDQNAPGRRPPTHPAEEPDIHSSCAFSSGVRAEKAHGRGYRAVLSCLSVPRDRPIPAEPLRQPVAGRRRPAAALPRRAAASVALCARDAYPADLRVRIWCTKSISAVAEPGLARVRARVRGGGTLTKQTRTWPVTLRSGPVVS